MTSAYDRTLTNGLGDLTVRERVALGLAIPGTAWTHARGSTVWLPATVMRNADGVLRARWFG